MVQHCFIFVLALVLALLASIQYDRNLNNVDFHSFNLKINFSFHESRQSCIIGAPGKKIVLHMPK